MEKLKDALKRLKGTDVSIGTIDGSNFMYIGRADNVELIEKIFDDYYSVIKNKKMPSEKKIICCMMQCVKKSDTRTIYGREKLIKQAKDIAKHIETLERYENYIDGYVDPIDRCIAYTFKSRSAVNEPMRIIITGKENGEFWLKSEFDLKYGNK